MPQDDRLVALLHEEVRVLRERIAHLEERGYNMVEVSGQHQGTPGPLELSRADAEVRLAEVEKHLRELERAS